MDNAQCPSGGCHQCPRDCGVLREAGAIGYCGMPAELYVSRIAPHRWEEPPISGTCGSGTVFFTGCSLRCVFCQNRDISRTRLGTPLTEEALAHRLLTLADSGVHNINLVTPTHYTEPLARVLEKVKPRLHIPVVWNSGGYERVETLRTLEGKVQIYLPDLKYALEKPARELSYAGDYFPVAAAAIDEMLRQVGPYVIGEDGLMKSGVIIRHLVLPGQLENTKAVIDYVSAHFPPHTVLFSLMSQYTPQPGASGALARRLNHAEYRAAVRYMTDCGITDGFCQELSSAKEEYTPIFDLQGV